MKKLAVFAMAAMMTLSMAACGAKEEAAPAEEPQGVPRSQGRGRGL